jgi:hypothetical protein
MSDETLPVDGPTVSEDNVAHFDITSGPDYPLENPPLEKVEDAQESAQTLEESE